MFLFIMWEKWIEIRLRLWEIHHAKYEDYPYDCERINGCKQKFKRARFLNNHDCLTELTKQEFCQRCQKTH